MAFTQPSLTLNKVYFAGQQVAKVSLHSSGDAYIIKGEARREIAFTDVAGNETDITPLFTNFTDKVFNDIHCADSGYVFVATNGDYLLRYNNNRVKHLNQGSGLQNGLITSLAGYRVLYMGTGHGLYNSREGRLSRFDPTYTLNNPLVGMRNTERVDIFSADRGLNFHYKHPASSILSCAPRSRFTHYTVYGNLYYRGYSLSNGVLDTSHVYSVHHVVPYYWNQYEILKMYHYRGTSAGLKKTVYTGCEAAIYLPRRKVYKLLEIRTYPFEIFRKPEMEQRYLLSATDSGLYINRIHKDTMTPDTLQLVPGTADLKIYDIDADRCYSKIWLATNKGLYTFDINHQARQLTLNMAYDGLQYVCMNPSFRLNAPAKEGFTFQWQKDGLDIAAADKPHYDATAPGTYRVRMVSTCYAQTVYSNTVTLQHDQLQQAPVTVKGNLVKCPTDVVILSTTEKADYQYQWYKDDKPLPGSVATHAAFGTTDGGRYKVKVTNCYGTSVFSESVEIQSREVPKPVVTAPAQTICYGESLELQVQEYAGKIQWLLNGSPVPSVPGQPTRHVVRPSSPNITYSIYQARFTNELGCSSTSDYLYIYFAPRPEITIRRSLPEPVCAGSVQRLLVNASYNSSVRWSTGSTKAFIDVEQPGRYYVTVTDRTTGCSATDSADVLFQVEPVLFALPDTIICEASLRALEIAAGPAGATYSLNGVVQEDHMIRISQAGTYTIAVENNTGCTASRTLTVQNFCDELVIPNIITPNGDNLNDFFVIRNLVPNCELKVINRTGALVYQDSNYQNNWSGDKLPDGAYYYHLSSPSLKKSWKGWLEISR
ncbi:gliding motility-associated C-terminal domain-containing protein [Pontibacter beigongshangensis]|uniref:gliding motility-associated C-terminal domain-containing protein n=1 Tax=Pontibacter beigongshangensis TaxID=2574733 RepID=UPI0016502F39|nr:gliding motility-associated C-terminal domain-containing protein [Pontibacter beigongshangensis]